jgi:hypothetical protein
MFKYRHFLETNNRLGSQNFPAIYGTWNFKTEFVTVRMCILRINKQNIHTEI